MRNHLHFFFFFEIFGKCCCPIPGRSFFHAHMGQAVTATSTFTLVAERTARLQKTVQQTAPHSLLLTTTKTISLTGWAPLQD